MLLNSQGSNDHTVITQTSFFTSELCSEIINLTPDEVSSSHVTEAMELDAIADNEATIWDGHDLLQLAQLGFSPTKI